VKYSDLVVRVSVRRTDT